MASTSTSVGLPLKGGAPVNFDNDSEAVSANAILEFQSPTLTLISAPAPFTARMTLWLISTFVILAIILFATVPIDRTVSVPGVVLAQSPDVIVQPLETAIVKKIYVQGRPAGEEGRPARRPRPDVSRRRQEIDRRPDGEPQGAGRPAARRTGRQAVLLGRQPIQPARRAGLSGSATSSSSSRSSNTTSRSKACRPRSIWPRATSPATPAASR